VSVCKSCSAPVRWVKTSTGKSMPIDSQPALNGNLVLHPDGENVHVATASDPPGRRFLSHFATCINAAQHRKPSAH
jgi:hypothetical protein